MDIFLLFLEALLATVAAWMYLNVLVPGDVLQTRQEENDAGCEKKEETEQKSESESAPERKRVFVVPSVARRVYLVVMLLSLWCISIALKFIYPSNTLTANTKLIALLAIIFVAANADARHRIIPNGLVLAGVVLRTLFWIIELITATDSFWGIMKSDLLACLIVIGFCLVAALMVKGGIGMGDVKLMLLMCLFQGFYGVISSLFCSLFVAFVYAIAVLLLRKKTRKDSVAFAPAILIGTILSVFLTGM